MRFLSRRHRQQRPATWRLARILPAAPLLIFLAAAQPNGVKAHSSLPCNSSFDPYQYAAVALRSCGFRVFPRSSVRALLGGGFANSYNVNGHLVAYLTPPTGFHPATASNARLRKYGFPVRPTNPAAKQRWMLEMTRWKGSTPTPKFLVETRAQSDTEDSPNWSGYVVSSASGTYHSAEAWYNEPKFYPSVCSSSAETTWAGIGGWDNTALGQIGTSFGVPGIASHQAFWEVWPDVNMMPIAGNTAEVGYEMDAAVIRISNGYSFYIYNYYTGKTSAFNEPINDYSGDSAEAIAERPKINNTLSYLSNFQTMTFVNSQANGEGIDTYSASGPRISAHMENPNNGDDLADPSDIGTGGSFTVTQHNCN